MEAIKQFVTDLVLNEDWDIDEVYEFTVNRFYLKYTEEYIKNAFDQALADLPELN